jgi:hypothetical protein
VEKQRKGEVMEMKRSRLWLAIVVSLFIPAVALFGGCGSSSTDGGGGTGTVSLDLADATINGVQAVYVTIEEVSVHKEGGGGWEIIAEPNQTYNLLELVNGVRETLGIAVLETGHYTQLRMKVGEEPDDGTNILGEIHPYGNYVIDYSDQYQELKIPSGYQTGIKVVCGFYISENQTTELILDFDAARSIVEAGASENLLLKPTIKVLETKECTIIEGTVTDVTDVTDGEDGPPLPGVLVSVQTFDSAPLSGDDKDRVIVLASTMTDENGSYMIFVEPGDPSTYYNIVAYKDGYFPKCVAVAAGPPNYYEQDFQLEGADTGTISGTITITEPSDDQHVTISFRQSADCSGDIKDIELKSVNVANGGSYDEEILPYGTYTLVAWTYGRTTQSETVNIPGDETQNFVFPLEP